MWHSRTRDKGIGVRRSELGKREINPERIKNCGGGDGGKEDGQ